MTANIVFDDDNEPKSIAGIKEIRFDTPDEDDEGCAIDSDIIVTKDNIFEFNLGNAQTYVTFVGKSIFTTKPENIYSVEFTFDE